MRMRAYFSGNSVPTPEQMGKMLAPTPEQAAAARKLMTTPIGDKPTARLQKKSMPSRKTVVSGFQK